MSAVHAHVERSVVREAEAARGLVHLRRRHSEIEENPCDTPLRTPWAGDGREVFEAGMLDLETRVAPESFASVSHGVRVFVQSE